MTGQGFLQRSVSHADKASSAKFQQKLVSQLQTDNGDQIKLSKHAKERLETRRIHVSGAEWSQIQQRMQEAHKMGVRDSLVITKEAALVVNTPNNTVITAMNLHDAQSHIFTNIDGTILIHS
ncbi:MAG: TIGR02530 family flagellar biosynthesis protein [Sporolactobacillus sp.]